MVAEGVESVGQLSFLRLHGCMGFQGYLFGRPAPLESWDELLFLDLQDKRGMTLQSGAALSMAGTGWALGRGMRRWRSPVVVLLALLGAWLQVLGAQWLHQTQRASTNASGTAHGPGADAAATTVSSAGRAGLAGA